MAGRATAAGAVAVIAAAAALAGCGSSQTATSSSHSTTHSPAHHAPHGAPGPIAACAGSQLALGYAGTQGAMGHLELTLALRNVSARACRLSGYPRAVLLDAGGRPLPLRVTRGHGFFPDTLAPPRPVAVAPGASVHFGLGFVTNNEYAGARACRHAATALSAPPGARPRWQRVSLRKVPRVWPCGDQLTVSPIHA